jgi:diguanylate cyclase (GGDEF)-like protein
MNTQVIERTEPAAAVAVDVAATPPVVDAAQARRNEGSWLCPSANARERMLDMDARLAPVRGLTLAALALVALSQAHWIGLWTLIPLIPAAAAGFALAGRHAGRTERPEYALFGAWVMAEAEIAVSIAISAEPLLLSWLAIPVVTLSSRFSLHGVIAGAAVAVGLMLVVSFATLSEAVIDYPPTLVMPLAVVVAVGILSTALMRSDVEHRDEAVIDQLTGMLNRHALARRAGELEQQSRVSGEPVAVVVCDIDCFKNLNDTLGHATGDAILRDLAYTLRKELRAFDLAYRIGGEEFLILVPGSDLVDGASLAERIRVAIAEQDFGPSRLTISLGVAATRRGEAFDYETSFAAADAALYEAKRSGRDRVVTAANSVADANA